MGRLIGATLVGYLAYFLLVFALRSAAGLLLGANGAFQARVWDVTGLSIILMLLASLVGALATGNGCARFVKDNRVPVALAGVVILMGLLFAWPVLTGAVPAPPLPRPETLPMFEAMAQGQAPVWVALLNPVIGAVGVLLGARLHRPV